VTKTNKFCTFMNLLAQKKIHGLKQKIREHTETKIIFKPIYYLGIFDQDIFCKDI
jgi:hypothetical protein